MLLPDVPKGIILKAYHASPSADKHWIDIDTRPSVEFCCNLILAVCGENISSTSLRGYLYAGWEGDAETNLFKVPKYQGQSHEIKILEEHVRTRLQGGNIWAIEPIVMRQNTDPRPVGVIEILSKNKGDTKQFSIRAFPWLWHAPGEDQVAEKYFSTLKRHLYKNADSLSSKARHW